MGELSNTTINGVSYDFKDAGAARQSHSHTKSQITDFPTSMPASDVPAWAKASTKPTYTASEVGAIATTAKGAASGVAELDANGKVPSSQLPSFVDDVLEYSAKSSFPTTGETGKIYVDTSNNKTYRWSGSAYVEISPSLALGETSSTAYRGDRGKAAYDHSQTTSGNPHNVTKSDVGLGNVGNFKAVSTVASQGLSDTEKANARTNIGAGTGNGTYSKPSGGIPKTDLASAVQTSLGLADTSLQHTTVSGSPDLDTYLTTGVYHIATSTATHAPTTNHATLFVDATVGTPYQIFKPDNVDSPWYTRHRSGSSWTAWAAMKFTDTTYSAATTSAAGLMSATDKTKLDGIASGATKTTVDSALSSTSTNPVQNKVINSALTGKASTAVATTSANGLMSSGDKTIVNKLSSNAYTEMVAGASNVSITNGGYIIIGKLCIVNVDFKITSGSSPGTILSGSPIPVYEHRATVRTVNGTTPIVVFNQSGYVKGALGMLEAGSYGINTVFMVQ